MKIVICTIKSWNVKMANELKEKYEHIHIVKIITQKEELEYDSIKSFDPDFIFFPHWSYNISADISDKFNCVVFHMTDLPFGRGGSPLQNLIANGIYQTKISALKVTDGIDEGPIYLKKEFDVSTGNATEIFIRATNIIFKEMIPYILEKSPEPKKQEGTPILFKRRKPSDGEIKCEFSISKMHDYIRMLDAEGYPKAFISFGKYKLSLRDSVIEDNKLIAVVEIYDDMENLNNE